MFSDLFLSKDTEAKMIAEIDPYAGKDQFKADYEAVGESYKPEETIFIDDIEANRLAARQIGWQTCGSVEELEEILSKNA